MDAIQRDPDQSPLQLRHRFFQQLGFACAQFGIRPSRKLGRPVVIDQFSLAATTEFGRDVADLHLAARRGQGQATAGVDQLTDIARPIELAQLCA